MLRRAASVAALTLLFSVALATGSGCGLVSSQGAMIGRVKGIVIDAAEQKPLGNVSIDVMYRETAGYMLETTARGEFDCGELPLADVTIFVKAAGYAPAAVTTRAALKPAPIRIELRRLP